MNPREDCSAYVYVGEPVSSRLGMYAPKGSEGNPPAMTVLQGHPALEGYPLPLHPSVLKQLLNYKSKDLQPSDLVQSATVKKAMNHQISCAQLIQQMVTFSWLCRMIGVRKRSSVGYANVMLPNSLFTLQIGTLTGSTRSCRSYRQRSDLCEDGYWRVLDSSCSSFHCCSVNSQLLFHGDGYGYWHLCIARCDFSLTSACFVLLWLNCHAQISMPRLCYRSRRLHRNQDVSKQGCVHGS
jgi:hypothetical protein